MGQLIKFPLDRSKQIALKNKKGAVSSKKKASGFIEGAELLFFTGVRYERGNSLPSQRLLPPMTRA